MTDHAVNTICNTAIILMLIWSTREVIGQVIMSAYELVSRRFR